MSRIAKLPVKLPAGVNATLAADAVTVKGAKGALTLRLAFVGLVAWGVFIRLNRSAEELEPEAMEQAKQEDKKVE